MGERIYIPTKTLYEWCVENNRIDINDRFDTEKNGCTTKDIGYKSNKKIWFKCPRGLHDSESHTLGSITRNINTICKCSKCNSVAQFLIDEFGEDGFRIRWSDKNEKSPWEISIGSAIPIWLNCMEKDYHVYEQIALSLKHGYGCTYCYNRKIHPLDSLGSIFPEIITRWSDKNTKTPYEYSPSSGEKAWFTCAKKKHDDYYQIIANASNREFRCPDCSKEEAALRKSGENSPFWKGGIHPQIRVLREKKPYKDWRNSVFLKDNYTCQCCGDRGGKLNAHHIYPFSDYEELRFNVDNGITLCENCHSTKIEGAFHNVYGTYNNTPDQLRTYILNKSNIDIYETHPEILSLTTQN